MAPFPITLLPPEPHLEVRQNGAPYEITLTITRATTTLTTTMALGQATPTSPNSNPQTTQPSTSTSSALPSAAGGGGTSNSAVIGAILGSLIGFLVIMAFLWFCCTGAAPNFVFWRRSSSSDSDSYYSYSDESESSGSQSVRVRRRGGGGGRAEFGWGGGFGGGFGVRRPERVRIVRERDGRRVSGTGMETRSGSSGGYRRRRAGPRRRASFCGWPFTRVVAARRTRGSRGTSTTTSSGSYVRSPRKQGSFWGWPFASTAMRETVRRDVWIGERRSSGLKYSIDD